MEMGSKLFQARKQHMQRLQVIQLLGTFGEHLEIMRVWKN